MNNFSHPFGISGDESNKMFTSSHFIVDGDVSNWTPLSLPNLKLWLRSDLGITLNGSNITAWADQSSNNNNATQAVAINQPIYIASGNNSLPEVDFDGITKFMAIASGIVGAKNWTAFLVFKADTIVTNRVPFSLGGASGGVAFSINGSATGKRELRVSGIGYALDGDAVATYEIWTANLTNAVPPISTLYVNGASQALSPNAQTPTSPAANTIIGALNSTPLFPFDGKIQEIIVCDLQLSTTNRNIVTSYLGQRYNLTIS